MDTGNGSLPSSTVRKGGFNSAEQQKKFFCRGRTGVTSLEIDCRILWTCLIIQGVRTPQTLSAGPNHKDWTSAQEAAAASSTYNEAEGIT